MRRLALFVIGFWALLAYHLVRRHRELEVGDEPDWYEAWRLT